MAGRSATGRSACECLFRRSTLSRPCRTDPQGQLAGAVQPIHSDEGSDVLVVYRGNVFDRHPTPFGTTLTLSLGLRFARRCPASSFFF